MLVRSVTSDATQVTATAQSGPVPVEVAPVRQGPIERRRTLTGTLEAASEFLIAPKVAGRVESVSVDLGDEIERGQVVVKIDDDEFVQTAAQARAAVGVAKAEHVAAKSALEIAERNLERTRALVAEGVATEANLDTARSQQLAATAQVDVAASEVARSKATLRAAEVRASYTRVSANWTGDDETRVVAARYADEGEMVAANTPLLSVVDLDPVNVVVHVAEEDYAELQPGKPVELTTKVYPGETFPAQVARVSPVFEAESRQARIELTANNEAGRLNPGMFVRAEVVLERVPNATVVPRDALVTREGRTSVFVVSDDRTRVSLRPVELGVSQGEMVQILEPRVSGEVVTLGQQQLEEGSRITIPDAASSTPALVTDDPHTARANDDNPGPGTNRLPLAPALGADAGP